MQKKEKMKVQSTIREGRFREKSAPCKVFSQGECKIFNRLGQLQKRKGQLVEERAVIESIIR